MDKNAKFVKKGFNNSLLYGYKRIQSLLCHIDIQAVADQNQIVNVYGRK